MNVSESFNTFKAIRNSRLAFFNDFYYITEEEIELMRKAVKTLMPYVTSLKIIKNNKNEIVESKTIIEIPGEKKLEIHYFQFRGSRCEPSVNIKIH